MDDINPLDITVVDVLAVKTSKAIKCLGYLWLGDILLMGRLKQEQHFGVIDHDIQVIVVVSDHDIQVIVVVSECAIFVWHKLCRHRQRTIIINIVKQSPITHYSRNQAQSLLSREWLVMVSWCAKWQPW